MKILNLSILMLLWAGLAQAEDCKRLNTVDFLENTPWDQVLGCIEKDQNTFLRQNQAGYNLLMTAVGTSISPFALDDLLHAIPEDQWEEVLDASDNLGRSLVHVAAAEAEHLGMFVIMSSYGINLDHAVDPVESRDLAGLTPLHFAALREDYFPIVAELLAMGASAHETNDGITPLPLAMVMLENEFINETTVLLAKGDWPEVYQKEIEVEEPSGEADCNTFLTSSFFQRMTEADVIACLTGKNQLSAVDRDGNSLMHLAAAFSQDPWIIDYILNFSNDPKAVLGKRNSDGKTPLHFAAEQGASPENLVRLLAWGADPNALLREEDRIFGKNRGESALHIVSSMDDEDRLARILVLLAFGADPLIQDVGSVGDGSEAKGGRTALHRAVLQPDSGVVATLLESQFLQQGKVKQFISTFRDFGIKQIKDNGGRTALHFAASRQVDFDTLWSLVVYGFSVDAEDDAGLTPLIFAAKNFSDPDNFLYLLEQSENPCVSSKTGTTVEAALRENKALIDVGSEDTSGNTLSPLAKLKERCP